MRFDQLKIHDAVLAILIAVVVIGAGASYRDVLARRFSAARMAQDPVAEVKQDTPPPPTRPVRVIAKAPLGAKLFEQQGATARPIASLKAGAVVEVTMATQTGWVKVRAQSGTEGWVSADSLETEAASASAVALFDSVGRQVGQQVSAPRSGALYADPALTERIGGFARKDKIEILRPAGRATLVATSDGAGGKIVAYAKTTEVRSPVVPRPAPAKPDAPAPDARVAEADPLADNTGGAEPPSAGAGDAALQEAQDQYAGGNFTEARAKAEAAIALGSSEAVVIAAMASCKLGELDKAMRYAKKLRGAKLAQFRTACSAARPQPPKPADDGAAQPTSTPTGDGQETP